ncbi:MAG: hypothetical protein IT436_00995 [Phycisphaerales bacterium]|nr:hypothetical protein [Phycisphaerales bacterium]
MKILILAEYIRRMPWSSSAWAGELARGLSARGHEVTIACDGLDDPAALEGLGLRVRRPVRTVRGSDPIGFQRWAFAMRKRMSDHASISLTPWCAGDVWIRLDADSTAAIFRSLRANRPLTALLELAHCPWILAALNAEARAVRTAGPVRQLRFAANAAEDESHALLFASRLPRPDEAQVLLWRARVREALGINPSREVLLLSAMEVDAPALEAFLAGVARLRRRGPGISPVVLAASRRSYSVSRAAARAGCEPGTVRHIGSTARIECALAACDAAVVPGPDRGASAGARFLADALRTGRPVLAHRKAPGASLLEPAHFGTAPLGLLTDAGTAENWAALLETAFSDGWIARAQRAARDAGPALSIDGLLDRLERHLVRRR